MSEHIIRQILELGSEVIPEDVEGALKDLTPKELRSMIAALASAVVKETEYRRQDQETIATLKRQATEDPLTGLLNRRGLDKALEAICSKANRLGSRPRHQYAVLLFDLDDFKGINDHLGHDVGDEALRAFARAMTESFREHDIIARIGGDEFLAILEVGGYSGNINEFTLNKVAEISENATRLFNYGGHEINCTAGAELFTDKETANQAFITADENMYKRKNEKAQAR